MKKYLLRLIDEDLIKLRHTLSCWDKMEDKFKEAEYHIKIKKAKERKISTITRYKERLINLKV